MVMALTLENRLLKETLWAMYNLFSQIDFGAYDGELKMVFGDTLKYDLIPWEHWETVLETGQLVKDKSEDVQVGQLKLF